MEALSNPFNLLVPPWGKMRYEKDRHGVVILDRKQIFLDSLTRPVSGKAVYVCAVTLRPESLELLCELVKTPRMDLIANLTDLSPLRKCKRLRHLAIRDNTKLKTLNDLRGLPLESLVLEETRRLQDLSPVTTLKKLKRFEYGGGWGKAFAVNSLEPLTAVPSLENLHLQNARVKRKGIKPLAGCKKLKVLELPNSFPVEDFAFLAARLPRTKCRFFAPWVPASVPGANVMITGSRMPFLHSKKDRERIREYENRFEELKLKSAEHP